MKMFKPLSFMPCPSSSGQRSALMEWESPALAKLDQSPYDPEPIRRDFDYIATKFGVSTDEPHGNHERPRKPYWDYRNQRRVFESGEWVLPRIASTRRGAAF